MGDSSLLATLMSCNGAAGEARIIASPTATAGTGFSNRMMPSATNGTSRDNHRDRSAKSANADF